MQTFINILAFSSFLVSAGTVGLGIYAYQNAEQIIDAAAKYAVKEMMEQVAIPEMPVPEVPVPELSLPSESTPLLLL